MSYGETFREHLAHVVFILIVLGAVIYVAGKAINIELDPRSLLGVVFGIGGGILIIRGTLVDILVGLFLLALSFTILLGVNIFSMALIIIVLVILLGLKLLYD